MAFIGYLCNPSINRLGFQPPLSHFHVWVRRLVLIKDTTVKSNDPDTECLTLNSRVSREFNDDSRAKPNKTREHFFFNNKDLSVIKGEKEPSPFIAFLENSGLHVAYQRLSFRLGVSKFYSLSLKNKKE